MKIHPLPLRSIYSSLLILQISTLCLVGCKNPKDNSIVSNNTEVQPKEYLEFYYLPSGRLYPMRFNCGPLYGGPLPKGSERHYLKITDKAFLKKFRTLYKTLQPSSDGNSEINARIQALVYLDGKTDTICMNIGFGISVNGTLMKDNQEFSRLVTNKLPKN